MLFQTDTSQSKGSWLDSSVCLAEHRVIIQREDTASELLRGIHAASSRAVRRTRQTLNQIKSWQSESGGGMMCWWFFISHASQRRAMSPSYVSSYWHLRRYLSNPHRAVGQITCDHIWTTAPNIHPEDLIKETSLTSFVLMLWQWRKRCQWPFN